MFRHLSGLTAHLHDVYIDPKHPNKRVLHYDQYLSLLLLSMFSPICDSLRMVQKATEFRKVQEALLDFRYHASGKGDAKGPERRYTRTGINQVINQLRRMWSWGVGREITTEAQCRRLTEVKPLRRGRSEASETSKRARVTREEFDNTLAAINPVVGDMLRLVVVFARMFRTRV